MIRISFEKKVLEAKNLEIFDGQLKEIEKLVKVNFDGTSFKIFLPLLLILTFISLRTSRRNLGGNDSRMFNAHLFAPFPHSSLISLGQPGPADR